METDIFGITTVIDFISENIEQKACFNVETQQLQMAPVDDCVEVDALISPTIQVLNRKGYVTSACCSGHIDEPPYAYIQFDFGGITPDTLPEGWYWDDCIQQMEYAYCSLTEQEIVDTMKLLYEWAVKLPDTH